jgi:hypothetical protein
VSIVSSGAPLAWRYTGKMCRRFCAISCGGREGWPRHRPSNGRPWCGLLQSVDGQFVTRGDNALLRVSAAMSVATIAGLRRGAAICTRIGSSNPVSNRPALNSVSIRDTLLSGASSSFLKVDRGLLAVLEARDNCLEADEGGVHFVGLPCHSTTVAFLISRSSDGSPE